jgi:hypothetical protein
MGRVETTGLDEIIKQMAELGELDNDITDRLVFAGAKIIKEKWKSIIRSQRLIKTGSMLASIVFPKKTKTTGDGTYIDVSPSGTDENGTRNALKAAILNYGNSEIPGSFFIDMAELAAEPETETVTQFMWDEYLKQKGL